VINFPKQGFVEIVKVKGKQMQKFGVAWWKNIRTAFLFGGGGGKMKMKLEWHHGPLGAIAVYKRHTIKARIDNNLKGKVYVLIIDSTLYKYNQKLHHKTLKSLENEAIKILKDEPEKRKYKKI